MNATTKTKRQPNPASLEEAIQNLVNAGECDPLNVARKLIDTYGDRWISEQLLARAEDILSELVRRSSGRDRRSAELALRPGVPSTAADLRERRYWIPGPAGGEWKVASELTPNDFRARGNWYAQLSVKAQARAEWCYSIAALLEAAAAATLGNYDGDLPELDFGDPGELLP